MSLAAAAFLTLLPAGAPSSELGATPEERTRVLIVSVDGLHPDLLDDADVPALWRLMREGAHARNARTVDPPYTVPAHVSMLTGVVPDVHGVTWNHHIEDAYPQVPTLFELARNAGRTTAIVVGKSKLIVFTKPGTLDWSHVGHEDRERDADIAARAVALLERHRPEVLFVHLGDVDGAGHAHGWRSPRQRRAVEEADRAIGRLVSTLEALDLAAHTLIVVTSDHGGDGFEHAPENPRSHEIPWIVAGPSIRPGFAIDAATDQPVSVMATFALALEALALGAPHATASDFPRGILTEAPDSRDPDR